MSFPFPKDQYRAAFANGTPHSVHYSIDRNLDA